MLFHFASCCAKKSGGNYPRCPVAGVYEYFFRCTYLHAGEQVLYVSILYNFSAHGTTAADIFFFFNQTIEFFYFVGKQRARKIGTEFDAVPPGGVVARRDHKETFGVEVILRPIAHRGSHHSNVYNIDTGLSEPLQSTAVETLRRTTGVMPKNRLGDVFFHN